MRITLLAAFIAFISLWTPAAAGEVEMGEDGLHKPAWLHATSGDLREDMQLANDQGKNLMILVEQRGCTYCLAMHTKNFQRQEILDVLAAGFVVVQLDMHGDRELVGFDGLRATEAKLVRKWRVLTTPVTIVLKKDAPVSISLGGVEAFRLPGHLKPFEHFAVLDYFASGAFQSEELQPFMLAKAEEFTARGIDPASW